MKKNIGTFDKILRILVGSLMIILYLMDVVSGLLAFLLVIIAAGLLLTALAGFCPCYHAFGVRSRGSSIK